MQVTGEVFFEEARQSLRTLLSAGPVATAIGKTTSEPLPEFMVTEMPKELFCFESVSAAKGMLRLRNPWSWPSTR